MFVKVTIQFSSIVLVLPSLPLPLNVFDMLGHDCPLQKEQIEEKKNKKNKNVFKFLKPSKRRVTVNNAKSVQIS
jgi:hypothetical protein